MISSRRQPRDARASSRESASGKVGVSSSHADRPGRSGRANHGAGKLSAPSVKSVPSVPSVPSTSPLSILLPYQRKWAADDARFKIGLWARQTGKSFTTAAETVTDCFRRVTTWVTLSAGERQALEWMRKAREWAEAYKVAIEDYHEIRDTAQALLRNAEITWPNGSRILAIPANPDTARGYSANLTLDEFAFHERPDDIWRAIYPSISNPLRGVFKLRIVSTPNGIGNRFHELWVKANEWSKHRINIHDAKAGGLPVDIEALRAGLGDPEGWAQEFECEFLDAAAVLLPYDLIATCESPEAIEHAPAELWIPAHRHNPIDLGIDFGRKRDLTVCWALETVGDVQFTRDVLALAKLSTPDQVEALSPRIQTARRVSLDYTGPGIGLGDYLVKRFGEWAPDRHLYGKIELCNFSNTFKLEIFSKLRMAFESRSLRIPISREIREDLHSIHRATTPAGNITYRAPHTDDGHADRCNALALAVRAASNPVAPGRILVPTRGRRAEILATKRDRAIA